MSFRKSRRRVGYDCGNIMMTKQSHKEECDINRILKQFKRTGIITHVQNARPQYTDLPDDIDFQNAMNTIIIAQETFENLPSKVRDHYQNDPQRFLAAFQDEKQHAQLEDFGLLRRREEPKPTLPAPQEAPKAEP